MCTVGRGRLPPRRMSNLVGISIRLITGSGRCCGKYRQDGGLASVGWALSLRSPGCLSVTHPWARLGPKFRHARERSGSLRSCILSKTTTVWSQYSPGSGDTDLLVLQGLGSQLRAPSRLEGEGQEARGRPADPSGDSRQTPMPDSSPQTCCLLEMSVAGPPCTTLWLPVVDEAERVSALSRAPVPVEQNGPRVCGINAGRGAGMLSLVQELER